MPITDTYTSNNGKTSFNELLKDKVERLELAAAKMRAVLEYYPDIEVISINNKDYYCSQIVSKICENVEFLTIQNTHCAYFGRMSLLTINDKQYEMYINSLPLNVELFYVTPSWSARQCKEIKICDYEKIFEKMGLPQLIRLKVKRYVVDFLSKNKGAKIDDIKAPDNIKKLLVML
jgi:hypothetical protein